MNEIINRIPIPPNEESDIVKKKKREEGHCLIVREERHDSIPPLVDGGEYFIWLIKRGARRMNEL